MFHYVEDKEFLHRAQAKCSEIVKKVETECRKHGLNGQAFLVGSGARNMVTQNENGPIDFDYNLNVLSCGNWNDGKAIKELVRKAFNRVMQQNKLQDVEDSKSSLTTKPLHFADNPKIEFSIDLAIVKQNDNETWERLIHEKTGFASDDKYYWNLVQNSAKIRERAQKLKQGGHWNTVREKYLHIKDNYLQKNDHHPSFVCYIEAVNNVYGQYFRKQSFNLASSYPNKK